MFLKGAHSIESITLQYGIDINRPLLTNEKHRPNDYYGHATILKKFAGIDAKISLPLTMEHGVVFSESFVWDKDLKSNIYLTLSDFRHHIIKEKTDLFPVAIGPYLHYAPDIIDRMEMVQEKRRLGKNLLVIATHSTHHIKTNFSESLLERELKERKSDYDSIRILVYWKDLNESWVRNYQEAGYEIVCAGHMYDPMFASRLKHYLQISNEVLANAEGTGIVYALFLGKPVYLVRDESIKMEGVTAHGKDFLKEHGESLRINRWTIPTDSESKILKDVGNLLAGTQFLQDQQSLRSLLQISLDLEKSSPEGSILSRMERIYQQYPSDSAEKSTLEHWLTHYQTIKTGDHTKIFSEKSGLIPEGEAQAPRLKEEKPSESVKIEKDSGKVDSIPYLTPNTLANVAGSAETWNTILGFHSELASDQYTSYLQQYYKRCRELFGAYWRYFDIVNVLYAASKLVRPKNYLEIGVRRGRSACVVAHATPSVNIYAFDMWQQNYAGMENPGPEFVQAELKKFSHKGQLQFVNGNSHGTLPIFFRENPDLMFDLITVDGDHTAEGALQDLRDVAPKLSPGGVLCFDDISHPKHTYLLEVWQQFVRENPQLKSFEYTESGYGVAFAIRSKGCL